MSTTITYPDEFFTTTAAYHLKALRPQQFRVNRVAEAFLSMKAPAEGERVIIPFDVNEHSRTTRVVHGYESADMTFQTIFKPGTEEWAFFQRPVGYSWVDDAKNSGRAKLISQIESRTANTSEALLQQLERQLLKGTVTALSDIKTLNGADVATGFIEAAAVGAQTNVVHNISKATYAARPQFQNQFYDMLGDFSANGLPGLRDGHTRVKELTKDPTKLKGFCSINAGINYGNIVQPQERYMPKDGTDAVNMTTVIDGIKYEMSHAMPNDGTATGVADKEWSFLLLDMDKIKLNTFPGLAMDMTPWRDVGGGHNVKVCFFKFGGQTTIQHWGTTFLGIGGDTF